MSGSDGSACHIPGQPARTLDRREDCGALELHRAVVIKLMEAPRRCSAWSQRTSNGSGGRSVPAAPSRGWASGQS
jgi:hypothetical protein